MVTFACHLIEAMLKADSWLILESLVCKCRASQ